MHFSKYFLINIVILVLILLLILLRVPYVNQNTKQQINQANLLESEHLIDKLNVTDGFLRQRLESAMALMHQKAEMLGKPSLEDTYHLDGVAIKELFLGNKSQKNNYQLVDDVSQIMGGTASIFSKTGDEFVTISTNIINNGWRAIGNRLDPEGEAFKHIQNKQLYFGELQLFNHSYLMRYEPMFDAKHQLVGVWNVGYMIDPSLLQQMLSHLRIMEKGFMVLRDSNKELRVWPKYLERDAVETILDERNKSKTWTISSIPFDKWNYEILVLAPQDEINQAFYFNLLKEVATLILLGVTTSLLLMMFFSFTEKLKKTAERDSLTGLYNRAVIKQTIRNKINLARKNKTVLSIAYIDLNKFKQINDNEGHLKGDEVLKHIGKCILDNCRKDDHPCRIGGDEFCIVLPDCSIEAAEQVISKVNKQFTDTFPNYSFSVGYVETGPDDFMTDIEMLSLVDKRMYENKRNG